MINEFTDYVLAKRRNSMLVVIITSFLPLFNVVANVVMSLVTLQRGPRAGGEILGVLLLCNAIISYLSYSYGLPGDVTNIVELLLFVNVCGFIGSVLLRYFKSWYLVIELISLIGLALVVMNFVLHPELPAEWIATMERSFSILDSLNPFFTEAVVNKNRMKDMANHVYALQAASVMFSVVSYIFIARWLQARRFRPKAMWEELSILRADYASTAIAGIILVLAFFNVSLAENMSLIAIFPLFCVGVSIVHHFAASQKRKWLLLISYYVMLLSFPVIIMGIMIMLAVLDLFVNIRGKYNGSYSARNSSRR